ncbi:alkyl sulfatase dimerization domain-containing protein [Amycolatopsis methanolica]|uniref:alkyl sulfatase dimerization domain-containing protein n=1 Tax=Amycolatopsis methanolica TaxID=1814 RepID=UPI003415E7D2
MRPCSPDSRPAFPAVPWLGSGTSCATSRSRRRSRAALRGSWHAHGYYGSVSHYVKAVYHRYLGWFDGNPARLWAHPPEAAGLRHVQAMGGSAGVLDLRLRQDEPLRDLAAGEPLFGNRKVWSCW